MRALFGFLAVLLGAISIALAARYGYKGADTELDGAISGVVFGAIALCAFMFDGAAVRLWFMRLYVGSIVIGLIAAAALIVTITNSLGAIVGRADATQAERARVVATGAELKRVTEDRGRLPAFVPADGDTVRVARAAVAAAERAREAECDKRGPKCRDRETDEASKRDALATVMERKSLTDRAAELDGRISEIRRKLESGPVVGSANPLGNTLELILGAGASFLTAWQQAIIAIVFELCLVGVMVIFELLGHGRPAAAAAEQQEPAADKRAASQEPPIELPRAKPTGNVARFMVECMPAAAGGRVEIVDAYATYKNWCLDGNWEPLPAVEFRSGFLDVCKRARFGIKREAGKIYCEGRMLAA